MSNKTPPRIRRFYINRVSDPGKKYGLGFIAAGVVLPSGAVVFEWLRTNKPHTVKGKMEIFDGLRQLGKYISQLNGQITISWEDEHDL